MVIGGVYQSSRVDTRRVCGVRGAPSPRCPGWMSKKVSGTDSPWSSHRSPILPGTAEGPERGLQPEGPRHLLDPPHLPERLTSPRAPPQRLQLGRRLRLVDVLYPAVRLWHGPRAE